jgi:hypothetical protein
MPAVSPNIKLKLFRIALGHIYFVCVGKKKGTKFLLKVVIQVIH